MRAAAPAQVATIWWAFILWPITGFGITGGAHRLWAHRSYKASFAYRFVVMLVNSCANQGTIFHWARDHRTHHRNVDEEVSGEPVKGRAGDAWSVHRACQPARAAEPAESGVWSSTRAPSASQGRRERTPSE